MDDEIIFVSSLRNVLSRLLPGDFVYARDPEGASPICLVTEVRPRAIETRRVTTQATLTFDRVTGQQVGGMAFIESVTPIPYDLHAVILGLERRVRLTVSIDDATLTDEEEQGLAEVARFYPAHPLPDPSFRSKYDDP